MRPGSVTQVGKTGDTWGWARCKLCGHQVQTDSYSGALTQIDAHLADEHPVQFAARGIP